MSNKNIELEAKAREHDISDINVEAVVETAKTTEQEIEKSVVAGYKKIETGVVEGYKKMESAIVGGFEKLTDKCVEKLFAQEGESVEDAKKRLSGDAE